MGHFRGLCVLRGQAFDIDPVQAALDVFGQDVDTAVVAGRDGTVDGATGGVDKDLDHPGTGCVTVDVTAELESERVMDQRHVELIGGIEDPVFFGGHVEHGAVAAVTEFVPELEAVAGFGEAFGAGAADVDAGAGA